MLRLAMLGYWHVHARDYEREAREHSETEVVAVWDDDPARGAAAAQAIGATFVPDLDTLLADPTIDGVVVTTATSIHHAVMLAAATAGKAIFTEKVIAPTVAETREIVAAAEAAGVAFVTCLPRLSTGYAAAIREAIERGDVGSVTHLRVRVSHNGALRTDANPDGWLPAHFYDPVEAAGGALIDLGCHPVYLIRHFLGMPATVSATYGYVTGRAVEDNAVVTFGYSDGALATAEVSFTDDPGGYTIEVNGTAGRLHYERPGDGLRYRRRPEPGGQTDWIAVELPPDQPSPFDQWVAHLQAGTTAPDNVAMATDLGILVEAANRSAVAGEMIRLGESS